MEILENETFVADRNYLDDAQVIQEISVGWNTVSVFHMIFISSGKD